MTRYFFDLLDSDGISTDDDGIDLPSMERVREVAARSLADMAREAVVRGSRPARWRPATARLTGGLPRVMAGWIGTSGFGREDRSQHQPYGDVKASQDRNGNKQGIHSDGCIAGLTYASGDGRLVD